MSERFCIQGCTLKGEHYASCVDYGRDEVLERARVAGLSLGPLKPATCDGCAPSPARHRALICDRCYGRLRRMLNDAPDLLGRIRSLADPMKARAYDQPRIGGRAVEAPAPVSADLIDAADAVMLALRAWAIHLDEGGWSSRGLGAGVMAEPAYEEARGFADTILAALDDSVVNDAQLVEALSDTVLTIHPADGEGIREAWSIADVLYRWRVERPDARAEVYVDDEDEELERVPVAEWGHRLLMRSEAAQLVGKSDATLRRWIRDGELKVAATTWGPMGRRQWIRESEVLATDQRIRIEGTKRDDENTTQRSTT